MSRTSEREEKLLEEVKDKLAAQTRQYKDFSLSVSGEIIEAPGEGKKLRLFDIEWSSTGDVMTSLRFGPDGTDMWPLQAKGVMSKNLVGRERDGPENTNLYGYLSGGGHMRGTIGWEIVNV